MTIAVGVWVCLIFSFIIIGGLGLFRNPIPSLHQDSNEPPSHSPGLRKTYYSLRCYGFLPYTHVKVGRVKIDLALLDIKVAILFYKPEDLLHPVKKRRLKRKSKFLIRNGWNVWEVREKDLSKNIHQAIWQIRALRK